MYNKCYALTRTSKSEEESPPELGDADEDDAQKARRTGEATLDSLHPGRC